MVPGAAPSPGTGRLPKRDRSHSWQPHSSAVSSDEKPGECEGQPEAGPGMGGQRQPEGLAHLGESTVGEGAGETMQSQGGLTDTRPPAGMPTPTASRDAPSRQMPEVRCRQGGSRGTSGMVGPEPVHKQARASPPLSQAAFLGHPTGLRGSQPGRRMRAGWGSGFLVWTHFKQRRSCWNARPSHAGGGGSSGSTKEDTQDTHQAEGEQGLRERQP